MDIKELFNKHSEQAAGYVSLAGSSLLLLSGNVESLAISMVFTVAEVTMALYGNRAAGYSAAAATFAFGDGLLAFSPLVQSGSMLQMSLLAMTTAWVIGALKYPMLLMAAKLDSHKLENIADNLPAISGAMNVALRVPGILSASTSNGLVATAILCWGAADFLAGRLQEKLSGVYHLVKDCYYPK